ncbi:hypothetical protein LARI1_G002173 [Lachnellula arida]|uniref:Rhodopsin domain-containing protein n=1 Tax=Lachnellula arida TaxID=1316785 RepID=A0A8T9BR88_9HELO|nr:hypothetical protein LARI1_G002173 [Lachnellula arida]
MGDKLPPFFRVTADDQGGIAVVVVLNAIIVTCVVSGIRALIANKQRIGFQTDDITFYIAGLFGNISAICVYHAVLSGLGKRIDAVSAENLDSFYKLIYCVHLFSILSMTFAKVSVVLLMKRITLTAERSWGIVLVSCCLWGVFSFLAFAFQCGIPGPWVYVPSQCTTRGKLQYPVIVLNIVTDVILSVGMLPTVWKLRAPLETRVTVMILFALRLFVPALSIGELAAVAASLGDPDQTYASQPRIIWLTTVTVSSVLIATIPRTNSFWASLVTGKASVGITEHEFEYSGSRPSEQGIKLSQLIPFSRRSRDKSEFPSKISWKMDDVREHGGPPSVPHFGGGPDERPRSEDELQLVPKHKSSFRTSVYAQGLGGDPVTERSGRGSTSDDGSMQRESSQNSIRQSEGVWVKREVEVQVENDHT